MAAVSLPVSRPAPGRALIVGSAPSRAASVHTLKRLGYQCAELDDPYTAVAELCRRPLAYRALILSLAGLYPEELIVIKVIKTRLPHIEIWLTQTDGRQSAQAEASRFGADGLLADEGMYRTTAEGSEQVAQVPHAAASVPLPPLAPLESDVASTEPILTAEELRALLQEEPSLPPTDH
jgi:hypothetical protein